MAQTFISIIFVDRNGFLLFSDSINRVLQFNFAPNVIKDLEVINNDELTAQIATFFSQAKLQQFQAVMLLSENLLFEKVFTSPQDEYQKKEMDMFLDNLPFEHVGSIIFANAESKFIATNKDLYGSLKSAFEKQKCTVDSIVPAFIVEINLNQMVSLTKSEAFAIFRKATTLKQYSFLTETPYKDSQTEAKQRESTRDISQPPQVATKEKKSFVSPRVILLIGVFVVLLVILAVVAYTTL